MTRNADLFNRLADHFEKHPSSWNQAEWGRSSECGTFACIAGTAMILTYGEGAFTGIPCGNPDCADPACVPDGTARVRILFNGEWIVSHAARLLGLARDDAGPLFGMNWRPAPALGLPGALRALADGATVDEVSA